MYPPVLTTSTTRRSSDLSGRSEPGGGAARRRGSSPHERDAAPPQHVGARDDGHLASRGPVRQPRGLRPAGGEGRSEEHTSELQSHHDLVCRLLLEKK